MTNDDRHATGRRDLYLARFFVSESNTFKTEFASINFSKFSNPDTIPIEEHSGQFAAFLKQEAFAFFSREGNLRHALRPNDVVVESAKIYYEIGNTKGAGVDLLKQRLELFRDELEMIRKRGYTDYIEVKVCLHERR